MITYRKIPTTENVIADWIGSFYNRVLMRKLIVRIAWNQHKITGRETHVAEMFGRFTIFDSRDRYDINNSGKVGRMESIDLYKASIWNSTAEKAKRETGKPKPGVPKWNTMPPPPPVPIKPNHP